MATPMDTHSPIGTARVAKSFGSVLALLLALSAEARAGEPLVAPANMPRIATIDERFQSYNIEMVEVTGGRFWRPYPAPGSPSRPDQDLYQYRPPIDLSNARLQRLAAALSPAYMRVSGTWANTTYFADTDTTASEPPTGFKSVLTRAMWRDVIDFARAVDARIVTSFAISSGTRDAAGVWTTDQVWLQVRVLTRFLILRQDRSILDQLPVRLSLRRGHGLALPVYPGLCCKTLLQRKGQLSEGR